MRKEIRQIFDDAKTMKNGRQQFANGIYYLIDRNCDRVADPFTIAVKIDEIRKESKRRGESEHGFLDRIERYANEYIKKNQDKKKPDQPSLF